MNIGSLLLASAPSHHGQGMNCLSLPLNGKPIAVLSCQALLNAGLSTKVYLASENDRLAFLMQRSSRVTCVQAYSTDNSSGIEVNLRKVRQADDLAAQERLEQIDLLYQALRTCVGQYDWLILAHADMPMVQSSTITGLIERSKTCTKLAVIPTFKGMWGYPVALHNGMMRALINSLGRSHSDLDFYTEYQDFIDFLPVSDGGILKRINNRAAYQKAQIGL